jgi:PAS domain-containing protein
VTNQTRRTWYLWSVTLLGVAAIILSAYRLTAAKLDARFLLLALVTVFVASRITIRVPRAKGRISVSDTFLFLTFLLFGGQAAVLVAALEAFVSSIHFSKKYLVRSFNASVMAVATFATATVLNWIYGDITLLPKHFSTDLIAALCIMALLQYGLNSSLIAISVALNNGESIWRSWYKNFLWTSITYFAGAFGAGIVARLVSEVGTFAFLATTPIITIIYFTYRTYLSNIEASAAQAEQARLHVAELNRQFAEQERISQALEESEAHFRTAFDHAAIGMALVSPEGCWLRVNRSLRDILGYDEEELLATDFQAFTHRDDLGRDLAELYRMLSGELQSSQLEKRFLHK